MLTSYRRILARPGALRFSLAGLFARLPISMVGLGIVLLVSAATGRYGVAGAVSAAYMLANAGFAILQGRLLDKVGQARVLSVASIGFGIAIALLVSRRATRKTPIAFGPMLLVGALLVLAFDLVPNGGS